MAINTIEQKTRSKGLKQKVISAITGAALFLQVALTGCAVAPLAPSYEKPIPIRNKYDKFRANLLEIQKRQNNMPRFETNNYIIDAVTGDTYSHNYVYSRDEVFPEYKFPFGRISSYGAAKKCPTRQRGTARVILPIFNQQDMSYILVFVSGEGIPGTKIENGFHREQPVIISDTRNLRFVLMDSDADNNDRMFGRLDEIVETSICNCRGCRIGASYSWDRAYFLQDVPINQETQGIYDKIVEAGNCILPQKIAEIDQERFTQLQARTAEKLRIKEKELRKQEELKRDVNALYNTLHEKR